MTLEEVNNNIRNLYKRSAVRAADRENLICALKWILEDDKFNFGTNWYADSIPRTDEELAGYYITWAISFLEEEKYES